MIRKKARPVLDQAPAAGTQTLVDLIAPGVVELRRDHVLVDGQYCRTLYARGYPSSIYPGWLGPLTDFDAPIELGTHIAPVDSASTIAWLDRQIARLSSSRNVATRQGYVADSEREVAYEHAVQLRDALQRGLEKLYSVGLYLLLRAASLTELDAATERVQGILDGMQLRVRIPYWEQDRGFRSVAPLASDELHDVRNLNTSAAAALFPFTAGAVTMEDGTLYGVDARTRGPVVLDPFDATMPNANHLLLGVAGSGKSFAAKLLTAERPLLQGTEVWAIDPEDEYGPLCREVRGQTVRLGAGTGDHLNPFDLPPRGRDLDEADPLSQQVEALAEFAGMLITGTERGLTEQERTVLDSALFDAYRQAGITRDSDTHGRAAPLLGDLAGQLSTTSLAGSLDRYLTGSLAGVFNQRTNVDLTRRLVVFDLSRLGVELRPKAIHLVGAYVWNQVRARKVPRLFLVDEAWTLLQYPEGSRFLSGLVRRARKHYLGVVAITQEVRDLFGSADGRAILSNTATKLLFRQDPSTVDVVTQTFHLSPTEQHLLEQMGPGECLLLTRNSHLHMEVTFADFEYDLATTRPAERLLLDAKAR